MEALLGNLALGAATAFTAQNLLLCFAGCLLGTLIGVLPGIGPLATMAMLLPLTFWLPPAGALIMLGGVFYGAQYGGSTTAILLRLPGESSSVVTCLDGHEMARQGRAGVALAIAAFASLFAGCVVTVVVALAAPSLAEVALMFQSADYVAVMVLGLVAAVILSHGSVPKALVMLLLGLGLGLVGTDVNTGEFRMTLGLPVLIDGLDFVPVALGLFGIAEIIHNLETRGAEGGTMAPVRRLMPNRAELREAAAPTLRGTALGTGFGILPGGGPTIASFAAYSLEKRVARRPEEVGRGAIAGVAGPEAANNAAAQASFIPMLSLGIPPNALMALMIGALMIQGITPGPSVITRQPDLFWGIVVSMWIGNAMLVVLNLPLIGLWVRLLRTPYRVLYPTIFVLCCVGAYSVDNSVADVFVMLVFGVLGWLLRRLEFEPAPLLIGLVLGPLLEENLRRALMLSGGDFGVFLERPLSAAFLAASALLLLSVLLPAIRRRRDAATAE